MTQRQSKNLIVRQRQPDNWEGPQEVFRGHLTPVQQFFVRNHFEIPDLDAESWSLNIEGAVDESCDWGLADLERFDQRSLAATLECAGNSRDRLGKRALSASTVPLRFCYPAAQPPGGRWRGRPATGGFIGSTGFSSQGLFTDSTRHIGASHGGFDSKR